MGAFEIELQFSPGENDPEDHDTFEAFLDTVMDQLATLGVDADYTATASDLRVIWTIDAPDASESSLIDALDVLRKALVAAGCYEADDHVRHEVLNARPLALA